MQAITNKDLDLNTKIALRSSKDKFFPAIYGCGKNIFGRPQNQNLEIEKKKNNQMTTILKSVNIFYLRIKL